MMRNLSNKLMIAPLVAGSLLCLASCGGDSDPSASGSADLATVQALFGQQAFTNLTNSLKLSDTGTIGLPFTLPGGVGILAGDDPDFTGCTTENGSKTDGADADGIPLSYRQDFNCVGVMGGAGENDMIGYYSVTDKDDTKYGVLGGFKFDFDTTYENRYSHETNKGGFKGIYEASIVGNTITLDSDYAYEGGSVPTAEPEKTSLWKARNKFTTTYTPEDMAQPWAKGTFKASGATSYSGTIYVDNTKTSYPLDFGFNVEMDVEYDKAGCGTYFKNGTMKFTDGAGNVLQYTYENCNQSLKFNGEDVAN